MKKVRLGWQSFASRITGFGTPVFGLQWEPPEDERAKCREIVAFLEDCRVLYVAHEAEVPSSCIESVMRIRRFLTKQISTLSPGSQIEQAARQMRASCRSFLQTVGEREDISRYGTCSGHWASWIFLPALGELRARIGTQVAVICMAYGVDVEEQLNSILPPDAEELAE